MKIKCNGCGHVGEKCEFRVDQDFFGHAFISGCPKCANRQNPGDASMRMFGGSRPFEIVRAAEPDDPMGATWHRAGEAS